MSTSITVHTSTLFDPKSKSFATNISIRIDPATGLITNVYQRPSAEILDLDPDLQDVDAESDSEDIDLRDKVVIPGLVDAHTHIFLHPYREAPALNQMRDESPVERVLRASNHCRAALLAGYTTYRDLGTEGLQDADANVRDAVNRGIVPGPRMFVATEAIASSGGYEIPHENRLLGGCSASVVVLPRIADVADGVDGVRAAVRRRIGAGADVVKFYADYGKRKMRFPPAQWNGQREVQFPPADARYRNPNVPLFEQKEMDAIVTEAMNSGCPVAAHAATADGVIKASRAGVTSVEHGYDTRGRSEEALEVLRENDTIFVPTLAVCEFFFDMKPLLAQTRRAWEIGVRLAAGGDSGPSAHGENARELELMVEAGVPLEDVLVAATLGGWRACGGDLCGRRFGWWEKGCAADVVALDGDPRVDMGAFRKVDFVMKDGRVWKRDGVAIGMT